MAEPWYMHTLRFKHRKKRCREVWRLWKFDANGRPFKRVLWFWVPTTLNQIGKVDEWWLSHDLVPKREILESGRR